MKQTAEERRAAKWLAARKAEEQRIIDAITIKDLEEIIAGNKKMPGDMSKSDDTYTQEYFCDAMLEKKRFADVRIKSVIPHLRCSNGSTELKIGLLIVNCPWVVIIETNFRLQQEVVDELATKKVAMFREHFRKHGEFNIYLGIAAMIFGDGVEKRAKELGIGIIRQKGDSIECDTEHIKVY